LLTLILGSPARAASQPAPLSGLDSWIAKAMTEWQTPGLTLAVVRRDTVLLAKGYGVREIGKPDPVDAETVFSIGSCSKAFTATLVAGLVGEGRLGWEDRAIDHLAWFRLWDPWVTEQVTIRDLLAHRVGADLFTENRLWPFARDMRDLVLRGGRQQPAVGFRERYRYSNNMFVAAGLVVEAVTGKPWSVNVAERTYQPLGMRSSSASVAEVLRNPNRAIPHELRQGRLIPGRWEAMPDSIIGPTGGINSSAGDMARWLRLQLGRGAIDGRRLIDSGAFGELHLQHTPVRGGPVEAAYWFAHVAGRDLETRNWAYALGWFVVDYRDRQLVWHGGTVNGFRCAIAFLPDLGVGMYVGVNRVSLLPPAVMLTVLDRLIGGEGRDWNAIFLRESRLQAEDAAKEQATRLAARVPGTRPSLAAERYAGEYQEPAFGSARVTWDGQQLGLEVGPYRGRLEHWHHDTFQVTWRAPVESITWATFGLDRAGAVDRVAIESLGEFRRRSGR
jgi:CubicO group peptidase (beta-lactamase class C family)